MKKISSIIGLILLLGMNNTFAENNLVGLKNFESGQIKGGTSNCFHETADLYYQNLVTRIAMLLFTLCVIYILFTLYRLFLARKESKEVKKKLYKRIGFGFLSIFILFVVYSIVSYVIKQILTGSSDVIEFVFSINF